jgi:hypothetical protein
MFRPGTAALALTALAVMSGTLTACSRGGANRPELAPARITTIAVNTYLWRASLDTLSFLTLSQVDSNGGVIVSDWYANPSAPNERMKVTVAILDGALRADALQVSASRQVQGPGGWIDAPVRAGTVQRLEEVILTRARELRQAASAG